MNISMRKVASYDEIDEAQEAGERGVFMWSDREGQRRGGLIVTLPAGPGAVIAHLPVRMTGEAAAAPVSWEWDGNEDAPTLSPSVWHDKPSGWHGWIRGGELVSA